MRLSSRIFAQLYILPAMHEHALSYAVSDGSKAGVSILTLNGPFILGNMFEVQQVIRTLAPERLIIDLSGVPYMDSAGLGVLMNAFVSAQTHGRRLILTGVSQRIRALLEMTKVDTLLKICDSIEQAEALA